jgi:hypothetical protein
MNSKNKKNKRLIALASGFMAYVPLASNSNLLTATETPNPSSSLVLNKKEIKN